MSYQVSGLESARGAGRLRAAATALLCALLLAVGATALAADETTLRVYFNHQRLAADSAACASVFPVSRSVPKTRAVASAALRELFAGPSAAEREAGYRSPFSPATAGLL